MNKKLLKLIESGNLKGLNKLFLELPENKTLEVENILLQQEYFKPEVVKLFVRYWGFSEEGEIRFIQMAPADLRRHYINYNSLCFITQQYVIDENLLDVARDFSKIKTFEDIDYLLEKGSSLMIEDFLRYHRLHDDEQVLALARHKCKTLFRSYVSREGGCFISEDVLTEIIADGLDSAFHAIVWQYGRNFKEKARLNTYDEIKALQSDDLILPKQFQVMVLESCNFWMVEALLKTTPLAPEAQKVLFEMDYDVQWLKVHFVNMYCVGGYRFLPQYEKQLFAALGKKNLDECLLEFKDRDEVIFAQNASPEALVSYIKGRQLSDEGQVAVLERGLEKVTRALLARFSPLHGMCQEAEKVLVEMYPVEVINLYTSFHSMCDEALELLSQKSAEGIEFYNQNHSH